MCVTKEIVLLAYSERGARAAGKLMRGLREQDFVCRGYLYEKYTADGFSSFREAEPLVRDCFERKCGLLFVCATGIAVRLISPFVQSKETDCPVLVMDETERFVIPLLSGHLGGANELAARCAGITGGTPVITTATDLHRKFAVDDFARRNNMAVGDIKKVKKFSAWILEGHTVEVCDKTGNLFEKGGHGGRSLLEDEQIRCVEELSGQGMGVLISPFLEHVDENTIQLIPRCLILGIGCRRGIAAELLASVVEEVLAENGLDRRAAAKIATIDLKKEEAGLLALSEAWGLPIETFSAECLAAQQGEFTASPFVEQVTGVDNVCERSVRAAKADRIVIPKKAREGITVSVGTMQWEFSSGRAV